MANLSNTQSQVLPHTHEESDIIWLSADLVNKQDKLVQWSNITIAADGKTISAKDTTYTQWDNITIDANNRISAVDTKYDAATQSASGLMSVADKIKLDWIASWAWVVKVTWVKWDAESTYREGDINITKANIWLWNVDNTSDADKPVSTAMQSALDQKQNIADMPTDLGDFSNNVWYIKNTVNDLTNYYKKTETYTQTEINNMINNFGWFLVVSTLPTSWQKTNIIYLLWPIWSWADKYEEWIYTTEWVKIGEASVDLTNYTQKSEVLTKTNTTEFAPTADYHPATKKYIDDYISSLVIPNIIYVTESEYSVLLPWAATDWNHYVIYHEWGWEPWANTIAYYPLEIDTNDYSGNNRNLTNSWVLFVNNIWWATIPIWYWDGWDRAYRTWDYQLSAWYTLSLRQKALSSSTQFIFDMRNNNQYWQWFYLMVENGNFSVRQQISSSSEEEFNRGWDSNRNHWVLTWTGSVWTVYFNWTQVKQASIANSINTTNWTVLSLWTRYSWATSPFTWYISKMIIENVAWTADEIADYYNQTKANYWIN